MKTQRYEPTMRTGRLLYVGYYQSQLTSLFLHPSRRGMILTPFVNALCELVRREHNLSMAFGMLETG